MSTLDSSMVNIALPFIMKDFHSSLADTQWVVLIYLLTITATLLFWGHLADRLGRGRIYTSGLLIFALGSLACTWAPGSPVASMANSSPSPPVSSLMMGIGSFRLESTK